MVDSVYAALVAEHSGVSRSAVGAQVARLQTALRRLAAFHRLAVVLINSATPTGSTSGNTRGESLTALESQQQTIAGHDASWR